MQNKEEVVTGMCTFYRPDYHIRKKDGDPPWIAGMSESDAKMLYIVMEKIYDEYIEPMKPFKKKTKKKRWYKR